MNQCPRCQSPVTASIRCRQCGLDFTLLRQVDGLESEIQQTRVLLNERLNRLDTEVAGVWKRCAEMLKGQSEASVAAPAPVMVPPPMPVASVVPPVPAAMLKATPVQSKIVAPVPASMKEEKAPEPANDWSEVPFFGAMTEAQLGQKWILFVGIAILVLGIGYFLKYSFDRNWIAPVVRVFMAYAVGGALLGVGEWLRRKHEHFGLSLAGGGIASLYFSTFAAFEIYKLLPAPIAFGLMVVVTGLACALALTYDTKWLAVLGLVGGFATPFVINTGSDNHIALFTYLTILNVGVLAIAFHKQWRLLNYLGFLFTWGLYSAWAISASFEGRDPSNHFVSGMFFLNLFYLIYAVAPFAALLRGGGDGKLQGFGVSVPNSMIAFGCSYGIIREFSGSTTWVSLTALAYAAIQLGLAQLLMQRRPDSRNAMLISLGQALFFLAVTVPIVASHQWITILWALQACLVLWVAQRVRSYWLFVGAMLLGVLAVGRLLFVDYSRYDLVFDSISFAHGYTYRLADRWLTAVITLGTVWFSGWLLKREREPFFEGQQGFGVFYQIVFGGLLFFVLNLEVGGFFHQYVPTAKFAAISVLWAIFSVALISLGFMRKVASLRHTAMALFALTIGKVFFVDMANVATPYRIISFIVLGLMLIGASFLYYKFRDRLIDGEGK